MPILENNAFWQSACDAFANDILELTILPTEKCNLRCTYCYETFELGKMSHQVVESVKNLLGQRIPELRRLKISWFGGEPLLAVDVIESIGNHVRELMNENQFVQYTSSATTNGVLLTADVARRLSNAGVKLVHVSLDGPAISHDTTRILNNGRGTFSVLEDNLTAIRDSDIDMRVELRVHVTALNADLLDEFTDYLAERYLPDGRFNVYFFPIVDLGGPKQGNFRVLGNDEAATIVRRLTEKIRTARENYHAVRQAAKKEVMVSNKRSGNLPYVCYAAKGNAWVIRSDGRLSKCTVGFEDERNDVGYLSLDGELTLKENRVQNWMQGWSTGDQLSLHCPYEGMREDVKSGAVEARS